MELCTLCPRKCNIDRRLAKGFCKEGDTVRIARVAPHRFEEPPISGTRGSGTVFFSGCSLKCVFCQNKDISREQGKGKEMSEDELYGEILRLQESGVHNINLVTPTHFLHRIIPILEKLKVSNDLHIPVVYNTSGYESVESLKRLEGLVDVYLPDFKYASSELAKKYSSAEDYPRVVEEALLEMFRQVGAYRYDDEGILKSGMIIRHLVLPSHRDDSIRVLERISALLPTSDVLLSLMSQYTPEFASDTPYKELHRRVTSFEYRKVVEAAERLGFDGFIQEKSSASAKYTPDF